MRFVAVWSFLFASAACDSNPTPHPSADTTIHDTRSDVAVGEGGGPDLDKDGVPDCAAAGGSWDGDSCVPGVMAPDAQGDAADVAGDTLGPDALDGLDGLDGEVGADGEVLDGGDAIDGGGESGRDAGPDRDY